MIHKQLLPHTCIFAVSLNVLALNCLEKSDSLNESHNTGAGWGGIPVDTQMHYVKTHSNRCQKSHEKARLSLNILNMSPQHLIKSKVNMIFQAQNRSWHSLNILAQMRIHGSRFPSTNTIGTLYTRLPYTTALKDRSSQLSFLIHASLAPDLSGIE